MLVFNVNLKLFPAPGLNSPKVTQSYHDRINAINCKDIFCVFDTFDGLDLSNANNVVIRNRNNSLEVGLEEGASDHNKWRGLPLLLEADHSLPGSSSTVGKTSFPLEGTCNISLVLRLVLLFLYVVR